MPPEYTVVRGRHVVAVGDVAETSLKVYADRADLAVEQVKKVWAAEWVTPVLVFVPFTIGEFERLTGTAKPDGFSYITQKLPGRAPYIVVDDNIVGVPPDGFLQSAMTHEMTHVASLHAGARPVAMWLDEGFATYVGEKYSHSFDLSAAWGAGPAPQVLPTRGTFAKDDFDAYFLSWSACLYLQEKWGERRLVALYEDQARVGVSHLDASLDRVLGVQTEEFTHGWTAWFKAKARSAR